MLTLLSSSCLASIWPFCWEASTRSCQYSGDEGRYPRAEKQAGGVRAPGELEDGVRGTEELEDGVCSTNDLGKGVTLLAVCD